MSLGAGACMGKGDAPGGKATENEESEPSVQPPQKADAASNGFGDQIAWWRLDEGLARAKSSGRPMMLIVHASWCARCKELKPAFADQELIELSQRFVMVNVDQDVEPKSQRYGPDGDYVPRVVFFDPESGTPDPSLKNERRSRNLYFYTPQDDLVGVMKKALARYGST